MIKWLTSTQGNGKEINTEKYQYIKYHKPTHNKKHKVSHGLTPNQR